MTIMIIVLIVWSAINSFLSITAILGGFNNHKEIEAIKSWYPFCEILKMEIEGGKNNGMDSKRTKGKTETTEEEKRAKSAQW